MENSDTLFLAKTGFNSDDCVIDLPTSKSISNRLLIIQALTSSTSTIANLSQANDTRLLQKILSSYPSLTSLIDIEDAGTCARFLTALLAITPGEWIITGTERMQQRPMKPLIECLRSLGAKIEELQQPGFLPLRITGSILTGKEVSFESEVSSQFLSAVLLISPYIKNGLRIRMNQNKQVSKSYLRMTIDLMKMSGIDVFVDDEMIEIKPNQEYIKHHYSVESDWSSASYWYTMVSVCKGAKVFLKNLQPSHIQGDAVAALWYETLGVGTRFVETGAILENIPISTDYFEANFSDCPDLVPAMAVCCAMHQIPACFSGVGHLIHKESNRIMALTHELAKIGTSLGYSENSFKLSHQSIKIQQPIFIKTYSDHRIAMAFSALCFKYDVHIEGPHVVDKSYPDFFLILKNVT